MTTITNPLKNNRFQATIVRGHCRAMAAGMTHSRISKTAVLKSAGKITGKTYKSGEFQRAADDLTVWLRENT